MVRTRKATCGRVMQNGKKCTRPKKSCRYHSQSLYLKRKQRGGSFMKRLFGGELGDPCPYGTCGDQEICAHMNGSYKCAKPANNPFIVVKHEGKNIYGQITSAPVDDDGNHTINIGNGETIKVKFSELLSTNGFTIPSDIELGRELTSSSGPLQDQPCTLTCDDNKQCDFVDGKQECVYDVNEYVIFKDETNTQKIGKITSNDFEADDGYIIKHGDRSDIIVKFEDVIGIPKVGDKIVFNGESSEIQELTHNGSNMFFTDTNGKVIEKTKATMDTSNPPHTEGLAADHNPADMPGESKSTEPSQPPTPIDPPTDLQVVAGQQPLPASPASPGASSLAVAPPASVRSQEVEVAKRPPGDSPGASAANASGESKSAEPNPDDIQHDQPDDGDDDDGLGAGPRPDTGLLPWIDPAENQAHLTKNIKKIERDISKIITDYPNHCSKSEYGKKCKAYYEAVKKHDLMMNPNAQMGQQQPVNIPTHKHSGQRTTSILKRKQTQTTEIGRYVNIHKFNEANSNISTLKEEMVSEKQIQLNKFNEKIADFPDHTKPHYIKRFTDALETCHNNMKVTVMNTKKELAANLRSLTREIGNLTDQYKQKETLKLQYADKIRIHDELAKKIDEFEKYQAGLAAKRTECEEILARMKTELGGLETEYNGLITNYIDRVGELHKKYMSGHPEKPIVKSSATIDQVIVDTLKDNDDAKADNVESEDISACIGYIYTYPNDMSDDKKYTANISNEFEMLQHKISKVERVAAAQAEADE